MNSLAEALAGMKAPSPENYQGMTVEQIQAMNQNGAQSKEMLGNLVQQLAGNRLTARDLTERERANRAGEELNKEQILNADRHNRASESIQKTQLELEAERLNFQKNDAAIKNALADRRIVIDEELIGARKRLAEAQAGQYNSAAEKTQMEIEGLEAKRDNLAMLQDETISIGGQEFSAYTVATTPTLSQGWVNSLTAQQQVNAKTRSQNALIESGVPAEVVYGMEIGLKPLTPAQVKKDLLEKGLSGGIFIGDTKYDVDTASQIIARDHNTSLFGKKTADKLDVDTPISRRRQSEELNNPAGNLANSPENILQSAVESAITQVEKEDAAK
jgi:hypothetical protein